MGISERRVPAANVESMDSHRATQLFNDACAEVTEQDPAGYARAFKLFEAAAGAGSVAAQHRLGLMLMYGLGVRRNIPAAVRHFCSAARCGDAAADRHWGWLMALEGFLWSRGDPFSGYWR